MHVNYPHDKQILTTYKPRESEKEILDFWTRYEAKPITEEQKYFKENEGTISFGWGPPFPTGSPHSGHVLNAILKDIYLRYGYQKYLEVKSNFHWDCHGLPVEHEVDKRLGIDCPEDILKMGIPAYNDECRKFLLRYESDWKNVFHRIGARVDFAHVFADMNLPSMERVWKAFRRLYDKGLIYKDTKVLPFSTGCFTHLSDLEAEQKSRHVTELGVTIALNIVASNEKILIWTVGTWKLPAAAAICVNPSARYVKVKKLDDGQTYIISKSRLRETFPSPSEYTPLVEFEGKMLAGLHCHSLDGLSQQFQFKILMDESVLDHVGTGIVALTPHFGEEDYRICKENDIEFKVQFCPIDDSGHFKECIQELAGQSIFEASPIIVECLQKHGYLFYIENIKRRRRFCWRSNTPLIEKLVSTWFICTSHMNDQIVEKGARMNWFYANGLEKDLAKNVRDWPVGRSRYWGTPVPIWSSQSGDEVLCVGSVQELLDLTGLQSISDLHREFVDNLQIKSKIPGNPPLRRVTEVFDCWFESSVILCDDKQQVDCIIEGSDQLLGWFHTTTAISAALRLPAPSKNIVVHGLVETSKGEKISKRKHNHKDPIHIVEKYGADALRLYLMTTRLVLGENFTLQEQDVPQTASGIFPLLYAILKDIYPRFGKIGCVRYGILNDLKYVPNVFDIWMLSRTERLLQFYDTEMTAFRPQTVIPEIIKHLQAILGVYIPVRRGKFRDKDESNVTFILYGVLFKYLVMLSPFAPFFTEHIYQIIRPWVLCERDLMYKVPLLEKSPALIAKSVEAKVDYWRVVVDLVQELRKVYIIPIKYRISELTLISPTDVIIKDDELLNETLLDVVNVHRISFTSERSNFGVELKADLKPESSLHQTLNSAQIEKIASTLQQLTDEEVADLARNKSFIVDGKEVPFEAIEISCKLHKELEKNQAIISQNEIAAVIRMNKDLDYYDEGTRLELINSVIKFRKKCKVFASEEVTIIYSTRDECMRKAFEKYTNHIKETTNSILKALDESAKKEEGTIEIEVDIKGVLVDLFLYKEPV